MGGNFVTFLYLRTLDDLSWEAETIVSLLNNVSQLLHALSRSFVGFQCFGH